jgi:hypothetical protein
MTTTDRLFRWIEDTHGDRSWRRVLDAGTGKHSLTWVSTLPSESWTAVTATESMKKTALEAVKDRVRPADRVVVGEWTDPGLLAGESFDVVLADYLLGAIDGFAPYFQDQLFERLRPHVGDRLYAVGLEPDPPSSDDLGGRLILDIVRIRDACITLCGDRRYREYPLSWVVRNLVHSGYEVVDQRKFTIERGSRYIEKQLGVALSKLPRFPDRKLASEMERAIVDLRARALLAAMRGPIRFGEDWIVAARLAG